MIREPSIQTSLLIGGACQDFLNYVPSARSGALAPHAWRHEETVLAGCPA